MGLTIRQVMPKRAPVTVNPGDPITAAARRMKDADVGDVLVTDATGLRGIVTDRDIVVRAVAAGMDPDKTPVEAVCSAAIATLTPDDEVESAVALMRKKAIRRIPIMEDGRPVSVLSIGDLALQRDPESALAGISRATPNR